MSAIELRLAASIGCDALNGTRSDRAIVERQIKEAVTELRRLRASVCKHGQLARSCDLCDAESLHHVFTPEQEVYIRSMGKLLRVTAVFVSDAAANEYMSKHDSAAVVAVCGEFIFLADKWDKGEKA